MGIGERDHLAPRSVVSGCGRGGDWPRVPGGRCVSRLEIGGANPAPDGLVVRLLVDQVNARIGKRVAGSHGHLRGRVRRRALR